jgi:hypothetical protein
MRAWSLIADIRRLFHETITKFGCVCIVATQGRARTPQAV